MRSLSKAMLSGRRNASGWILEELSANRPLPAGVTPQRFVDSRFVRELVNSGFIDALYKGR